MMIHRRLTKAFAAAATILFALHAAVVMANPATDAALTVRVDHVLKTVPLIDGHNDLPWEIRERFGHAAGVDLSVSTANLPPKVEDSEVAPP